MFDHSLSKPCINRKQDNDTSINVFYVILLISCFVPLQERAGWSKLATQIGHFFAFRIVAWGLGVAAFVCLKSTSCSLLGDRRSTNAQHGLITTTRENINTQILICMIILNYNLHSDNTLLSNSRKIQSMTTCVKQIIQVRD